MRIIATGTIMLTENKRNKFIVNAENLDIDMLMCTLLEYNNNYSLASESLWNYLLRLSERWCK